LNSPGSAEFLQMDIIAAQSRLDHMKATYRISKSWLKLCVICIHPDTQISKPAIKKALSLAENAFAKVQFRVLKDPLCLEIRKKMQSLERDLLMREWDLEGASPTTLNKINQDCNRLAEQVGNAEAFFLASAEITIPGFINLCETVEQLTELFYLDQINQWVPSETGFVLDAFGDVCYWQKQIELMKRSACPSR